MKMAIAGFGIRAYALVGFFIISLLFTQYALGDDPSGSTLSVETDRSSYNDGDTIRISGNVEIIESDVPVTILIVDPAGEIVSATHVMPNSSGDYSHSITAGNTMEDSGDYKVRAQYGTQKASTTFYFENVPVTVPPITVSTDRTSYSEGDTIRISGEVGTLIEDFPPVSITIISPSGDIVALAQPYPFLDGSFSTTLGAGGTMNIEGEYTINAFYGIASRSDSTTFVFGETTTITVPTDKTSSKSDVLIPNWIRNNAKWWASGQIGDSDFTSGIQFMIKENIMVIPDLPGVTQMELKDEKRAMGLERGQNVPDWVRNNAGWWSDGLISDDDFVSGIKYLVEQGIIKV